MNAFISYLKKYGPLSFTTQEALMSRMRIRFVKAKAIFQQEASLCEEIFFIRKGLVQVYRQRGSKRKTHWLAQEDQLLCAYNHFLRREPAGVNYITLEACEIHTLSFNNFQQLLQFEDFKNLVNQIIIDKLYSVNHFLTNNTGAANERYHRFLHYFPALASRVPVHIIASFLDVSCKTITRIRAGAFSCSEYLAEEPKRMAG